MRRGKQSFLALRRLKIKSPDTCLSPVLSLVFRSCFSFYCIHVCVESSTVSFQEDIHQDRIQSRGFCLARAFPTVHRANSGEGSPSASQATSYQGTRRYCRYIVTQTRHISGVLRKKLLIWAAKITLRINAQTHKESQSVGSNNKPYRDLVKNCPCFPRWRHTSRHTDAVSHLWCSAE